MSINAKAFLALAALVAALLLPAAHGEARASDAVIKAYPTDNLPACRPAVQAAVRQFLKKSPRLHFECGSNGFLKELLAPAGAELMRPAASDFARKHWQLFLPTAPGKWLQFKGAKKEVQAYRTFSVFGAHARKDEAEVPKQAGTYARYSVELVDASGWTFSPAETISCLAASERARALEATHAVAVEADYRCEPEPVIMDRCGEGPALVQRVVVVPKNDAQTNIRRYRVINVDTAGGKICPRQVER